MNIRSRRPLVTTLLVIGLLSIGSLAYASHSFNDVPDSHTFHDAIGWMKDSGITVGCNPPANTEYCPDENVTRGQMAAFIARAANSQAFDAGTLDGIDSSGFVQTGGKASDSDLLDGKDSTDFIQQGDPVSDTDLLDGKDSSEFLSSSITVRGASEDVLLGPIDVTVECEAGEVVIGGGFESGDVLGINVTDNHPTETGWHLAGTVSILGTVTVYAICAGAG